MAKIIIFVFVRVANIVGKEKILENKHFSPYLTMFFRSPFPFRKAPPRWLSDERVGLMTWWLRVRSPVEATFLSGVFSPLTSAEAYEKSSRWLWKEKLC